MDQFGYKVTFEKFTERHFTKSFEKKYKSAWIQTRNDIIFACEHIQNLIQLKRADVISSNNGRLLVKLDFAIFGSRVSPKSSGNRCILFVDQPNSIIDILLVYSKNDISSPNETQKWQHLIAKEYPHIKKIFNL